jgi:LPS-assembly lipoprotein
MSGMHGFTLLVRLLSLTVLVWLGGCGFHLKGYHQASPNLDGLYVEQNNQSAGLAEVIRQQLLLSEVELAELPAQAKNLLRITRQRFGERVISVDANGKVLEYELLLQVEFTISARVVPEPPPAQRLELTRYLTFSGEDELGRRNEAELIRSDMLMDMADQIIRQLQAQLQ